MIHHIMTLSHSRQACHALRSPSSTVNILIREPGWHARPRNKPPEWHITRCQRAVIGLLLKLLIQILIFVSILHFIGLHDCCGAREVRVIWVLEQVLCTIDYSAVLVHGNNTQVEMTYFQWHHDAGQL
jgi:hypothetical protein